MFALVSSALDIGKSIGLAAFLVVFFVFSLYEVATFIRCLWRMWKEHDNVVKK